MHRSVLSAALVLLALGGGLIGGADASEQYPTRPITLVNPFPPGGLADLTGRPLASALERLLKQPVNDGDLIRYFRAAEDDHEWTRGLFQFIAQELELALH